MPFSPRTRIRRTLGAAALAVVGGLAAYTYWYANTPVRVAAFPVEFEIPAGTGLRGAARILDGAGIAVHPLQFELLARATGRDTAIKAGNYELAGPASPVALLEKLTRGEVTQAEITIIEGWTFAQLRAALDASPLLRHDTAGLGNADLMRRLGVPDRHPEGMFFPDTYLFARQSSDVAVLRRALHAMRRHLDHEWQRREGEIPYKTPYEALIMASIVEKETGAASERDEIAGVLVNRLRIGMALQADPTVIYGLGESFDGNLKRVHLDTDGPYNTYMRPGLPPTPIALPGRASLRAALRPAKTKALYYVSRGDGTSAFSRSLEEHNRAVSKYQLKPRRKR
jgi:UPF0755 protein